MVAKAGGNRYNRLQQDTMEHNDTEGNRGKGRHGRAGRIVARSALLLFVVVLIALPWLLPSLLESYLARSLAGMGLKNPRLEVRHAGFRQLDVQQLTLGSGDPPDLVIPSLAVDFSLPGILEGRVDRIAVTGMRLRARIGPGGVTVRGLEPLFKGGRAGASRLPFRRLQVASALADVEWNGRRIVVPFDLQALAVPERESVSLTATLYAYGEPVALSGTLDLRTGDGALGIAAERADAGKYLADVRAPVLLWLASRASLHAGVQVKGWRISAGRVSLSAPAFSAGFPGATLTGALQLDFRLDRELRPDDVRLKLQFDSLERPGFHSVIPFVLDASGPRLDDMAFRLGAVQPQRPPGIVVRELSGRASLQAGRARVWGSYGCKADASFFAWLAPALRLKGDLALRGAFELSLDERGSAWKVDGKGRGWVALPLPFARARADGLSFSLSSAASADGARQRLELEFKGLEGRTRQWLASAPALRLQGTLATDPAGKWSAGGRLTLVEASAGQAGGSAAGGVSIDMPWRFPPNPPGNGSGVLPGRDGAGSWRIASLKIGDLDLGRLAGEARQTERGITISGEDRTPAEMLRIRLDGDCAWSSDGIDAALRLDLPETRFPPGSSLQGLHPALAQARFSGSLAASASLAYRAGALESRAQLRVRDGELGGAAEGFDCRGLNATLRFKDLLNARSEDSQRLDFQRLAFSGLQLDPGHIFFAVDGTESVYVEGGEFAFSGGRILLQPFRLRFQDPRPKVTLYCDRVNFARLLNALLGENAASGDAELNGLLTVDVIGGLPVFRDGYLYSTPGIKGNIQFARSEAISGGVLIVEEAAKDFNYEWIKVKLDTAGDRLALTAFINGVPARKLPLTLDPRSKEIVRDPSGRRRVELKGLLLELRFTDIDLKRLMQGGMKIRLQEKMVPQEKGGAG